jgi:hypothetical protein
VKNLKRFPVAFYVISFVSIWTLIWTIFLLNPTIDVQYVPTLVNGLTSSTSVIVGLSGVIIGIMFREIGEGNPRAKGGLVSSIFVLALPIALLWTTYAMLTMGEYESAIKFGLSGLIFALYLFLSLIIFVAKELGSKIEKNS